jgi:hypothetical protein
MMTDDVMCDEHVTIGRFCARPFPSLSLFVVLCEILCGAELAPSGLIFCPSRGQRDSPFSPMDTFPAEQHRSPRHNICKP